MAPAAQLELGRAYQKQGDTAKARIALPELSRHVERRRPRRPLLLQGKGGVRETAVSASSFGLSLTK